MIRTAAAMIYPQKGRTFGITLSCSVSSFPENVSIQHMERFGGLAKRTPENDKEMSAARVEAERLERVAREDVEKAANFLHEVVGKTGSYRESIPLDGRGEINRESFANIHAGRSLLERAWSVSLTMSGFNAFMADVEKQCPDYSFTLVKEGDFLNLTVASKR